MDLFTNALLAIFIFLLVMKILGRSFALFFNRWITRDRVVKNNPENFDLLVEREKFRMRTSMGQAVSGDDSVHCNKKKQSETPIQEAGPQERYLHELKQEKSDSIQYQEFKKILKLFDNAKWGEGEEFRSIASQLKMANLEVDVFTISHYFKFLITQGLLIKSNNTLLGYNEIINLLRSIICHSKLIQEYQFQDGPFIQRIREKRDIDVKCVLAAIELLVAKRLKRDRGVALKRVLKKNYDFSKYQKLNDRDVKLLALDLSCIEETLIPFKDSISIIKNEAELIKALSPLPKINNKLKEEWALKIFSYKVIPEGKVIKSDYKSLIKKRHPDKLAASDLPHSAQEIIHENFTKIQEAYDFLKKKSL